MGMDVTTAAYHNSYDVAKKETKRVGDRGSAKTDNLQDLRDVLAVGKSVERTDLEKMMKKYDPEAYAEYSKLVQESQNTISFMSQWTTKMKKALQDGSISPEGSNHASASGRLHDKGFSKTDNLQDLRDVLAVGKSVERTDLEKMMKKYDPDAYAQYSKLVQESQNTISFMSQWTTKMKKALQDGTIVSGRPKPPVRNAKGNVNVSISKEARELFDGKVVKKSKPPHEAPNAEKQNTTHFSNINDPNDHGFFTKIWDEDGNVVWDASWKNDLEQPKPEHGMPPHGEPSPGQLPHWTEISKDLAEHGFYKNMTRQEIDHLEGFLRSMRSVKDLNIFADKHTSGNLREFLKELAEAYATKTV